MNPVIKYTCTGLVFNWLSFSSCSGKQKYPEELTNVLNCCTFGAIAGLIYGGLPAARHARQRYIHVSQAELYTGRVDAVVSEDLILLMF